MKFDATREKTRLWLLLLIGVVATLLGQTHAREIFAPSPHGSGIFATQTQASTGEIYDVCRYDAPDSLLAANSGRLAGSGPAAGVLEVSPLVKSTKAFQNYNPSSSVEFVFDAGSNRFVVGRAAGAGSPHQNLAGTISGEGSSVVGGMFQRGSNAQILTNEFSGHYWQNWTPQIRTQFQGFMESTTGQGIIHTP